MSKSTFIGFVPAVCHDDTEPSCATYADGSGYCFPCSYYYPPGTFDTSGVKPVIKPPEDIKSKIAYIKSLPTQAHRGLVFPYDSVGYYIVWPDECYYKCRKWLPDPAKYVNPRGITQPGFYLKGKNGTLILIEGEINALSVHKVFPRCSVLSPGSAGNFKAQLLKNYLADVKKYANIIVIVDYDKAGLEALKGIKKELNKHMIYPKIYMNSLDMNEMLVKYGEEKIKAELKDVGL